MFFRKTKFEALDTDVSEASLNQRLFDAQNFRDSFVLYGNFRTGSHFFKDMVASVSHFSPTHELFPKVTRDDGKLTFRSFVGKNETSLSQYISEPRDVLNEFFAEFFEDQSPTAPIFDIKYSQSYTAGVNDQEGSPFLLEYFKTHSLKFVHLIRRDFVAQSISHLVAIKTNQFMSTEPTGPKTQNSPTWISPEAVLKIAKLKKLQTQQATKLLEYMEIEHTTVFYEDLHTTKTLKTLNSILNFLGTYSEFESLPEAKIKNQESANKVLNIDEIYQHAHQNGFLSI